MIDQIPVDKIIQTAMHYGADFAEVFCEQTRFTMIDCDNNAIENVATNFDTGVGIRVISDNRIAYGSSNNLDKNSLLQLAKSIGKTVNAKTRSSKSIHLVENCSNTLATVSQHPYGIALDKKADIVTRANDLAWTYHPKIKQVKIMYRDRVRRILIASSEGIYSCDEQVGTSLLLQIIAANDTRMQTSRDSISGSIGFELFDTQPPEELVQQTAARALVMLDAAPAPSGKMPVVIDSLAGGTMIHEAVGHGLEGDLAAESCSIYADSIGKEIANPIITVIDDGTLEGYRGSFTHDDEGSAAQKTVLIENGVLKTYMLDHRYSNIYNATSTGNARRQSYAHLPIVRMTNTFIAPGKDTPSDILKQTPNGLLVKSMGGGQVNTINGDFIFEVQEGYMIENGQISHPVRGASLIGNGPEILKTIDKVGTDLGFSNGTCGKQGQQAPVTCGQPTIRIPEIVIGGTA